MRELSQLEVAQWYAIAVGEIGIPPANFYDMTKDEIMWAYEGYRQRQQDTANLILLAIGRAQGPHKDDLFEFVKKKGYKVGNLQDRHKTFTILGIQEDEFNG